MGWFANILLVIGLFLVGERNRSAFVYTIIGELVWVYYSLKIGMYDLAFICAVFAGLALLNWYKWGK